MKNDFNHLRAEIHRGTGGVHRVCVDLAVFMPRFVGVCALQTCTVVSHLSCLRGKHISLLYEIERLIPTSVTRLYGYKPRTVIERVFKDVFSGVTRGWQAFRALSPSLLPVRTASSSILILSSCCFLPSCTKSWRSEGELTV